MSITDNGQLREYAKFVGVSLKGKPKKYVQGQHDFLIWGDDPCVYFKERDNEVGYGCRAFVDNYALTDRKHGGQHDEAEFLRSKKRDDFYLRYEYEQGVPPPQSLVDQEGEL